MTHHPPADEIASIQKQLRRQALWLRVSTMGWILLLMFFFLGGASEQPTVSTVQTLNAEEINVSKINVIEPDGVARLVIANSERFPPPILNGKLYHRKVQPAGLVFYDASGSEMGGLAITDTAKNRVGALAFDYPNYDAIGLRCAISEDGKEATSGLVINSRPPAHLEVPEASKLVHTRIGIQNHNENAEILLSDPDGNNRIRLVVDDSGEPRIELLDSKGKVRVRIPEKPFE